MLYLPIAANPGEPAEVDVRPLAAALHDRGCSLFWPRCDWRTRAMTPVGRSADAEAEPFLPAIERRRHGVPEPTADGPAIDPAELDLVVVPGVAFDRAGNRLGRGGGFYDRFLPRCPGAFLLGVGFAEQMVETMPAEAHDRPVDGVATDAGVMVSERSGS